MRPPPDTAQHSGFYASGASGADGTQNETSYRPYIHASGRPDRSAQLFFGTDNEGGNAWIRSKSDAGWLPSHLMYSQANILGTVSQSSGQPTGAVIERGANSDGEFVRFADGTQLCSVRRTVDITTSPSGSLHVSAEDFGAWTFLADFAGAPCVQSNIESGEQWCSVTSATATEISGVTVFSINAISSISRTICVTATGRWF